MAALAKMGHHPGGPFMELLVDTCTGMGLNGFKPQGLANILNGEQRVDVALVILICCT
jgi:hypothetical protein